ncbi:hypothetical protein SAMN00120144_2659 [Hymenobacter roseosalivarius DSM 11622]|uniref:Uncharacterized protein n=1 Tax=Hymenobacter roseosalivarius DSM 11622 TaxID=645990 RepID=A0A1W1VJR1_9BACT|nr:hypothetical protein [Hymenobacter roseosalivarius]SMB93568.1 hypothetical protein SAMN00120144_2659 [Hymenobacter roseosalivarius DSM 11622]
MKYILIIISTSLIGLSACKKEKNPLDTLPEATQTGANTVGWLQDGKAYQPTTNAFNSRAIIASRFSDGDIRVSFFHDNSKLNRFIVFNIRRL